MGRFRWSRLISALGTAGAAVAVLVTTKGKLEGWLIAAAVVVLMVGLDWLLLRPLVRTETLLERGEPAEATVLQMWDTGWTINDDPRVGLRLEVRPLGSAPFQVETKSVVSRLVVGQVRPGAVVQVRYDPQDRRRVVVVPNAEVKVATPDPAERLARLEELRARGLVTAEEYGRKRQEILDGL